jgi:hypothetical protein
MPPPPSSSDGPIVPLVYQSYGLAKIINVILFFAKLLTIFDRHDNILPSVNQKCYCNSDNHQKGARPMHRDLFHHQELEHRRAVEQVRTYALQRALVNIHEEQRRARRQRGPLSWLMRVTGRALVRVGSRMAYDPYEATINLPISVNTPFSRN